MDLDSSVTNVLIITDLFPQNRNDLRGIFILDYIESIKNRFKITVYSSRLISGKRGFLIEKNEEYLIYRYALTKQIKIKALKPLLYILWFYKSYSFLRNINDIDLVHAHGTILSGTLGWLYSKSKKIPFLITEHQGPFSVISGNFFKLLWSRFILHHADVVLTVSNHLKEEILRAGIFPRKIIVTYNPVDTSIFNLINRSVSINSKFVFASRLDPFKGALRCLNAFKQLINKYSDWQFIIIGDGEEYKSISNILSTDRELNDRIILKGFLKKEEIANIYKCSDFFILPSLHESFGLVITEAMACGLPVIAPNVTAPPEYVNIDSGLLINPMNTDEISHAIEYMILHNQEFDREKISQTITNKFSIDEFGQKLQRIYSSLLD